MLCSYFLIEEMFQKLVKHALKSRVASIHKTQLRFYTIPTINDLRQRLRAHIGASKSWNTDDQAEDTDIVPEAAKSQDDLEPRLMQESFYEALIPLRDEIEREQYTSLYNTVRFGKLLENLDTFAVHISYLHNCPLSSSSGRSPLSIVTAMVDEIKFHDRYFDLNSDILMRGHVSWVGKTSMEIKMWLTQHAMPVVNAMFVMVARDKENKPAFIHPLQLSDEEDKALFAEGEAHKIQRLEEAKYSLFKFPPREDERSVVHNLFLNTLDPKTMSFRSRKLPEGCIWMEDTKLKTSIVCFPDKRNIHNKIFGGYLMRQGFELAWANACIFCKTRPFVKAVDDILFRCPVPIGSLLLMSSQVSYSEGKDFHVRVHAEVLDPRTGVSTTSNTFNFTFTCEKEVPTVMPKTYGESMLHLDGRRHFNTCKNSTASS